MSDNKSNEQQFTIQPHPATTNDPRDLQGLGENANAFTATGPHVPSAQVASNLEQPKSREELQAEAKKLNE